MSHSIHNLRAMTDLQLIQYHDEIAVHTSVGVDYYLEELHRRETRAAMRSNQRLAMAATALSIVGTAAAVLALFLR